MDWGNRDAEEFTAVEVTEANVVEVVQRLVNLIGGGSFGSERDKDGKNTAFWFKGMRFAPAETKKR